YGPRVSSSLQKPSHHRSWSRFWLRCNHSLLLYPRHFLPNLYSSRFHVTRLTVTRVIYTAVRVRLRCFIECPLRGFSTIPLSSPLGSFLHGFSIWLAHEDSSEATSHTGVRLALLKEPNLILNAGVSNFDDGQASLNHHWEGERGVEGCLGRYHQTDGSGGVEGD
ncbi:hypothetical protein K493DRAFT_372352, partial [Basidiobolus meristosporus CBS 931.73]